MFDVIIIGSGASGLFSAVLLSQKGKKVLVIEKNTRSGKKLSLCGGGNCNLGPEEKESDALCRRYTRYLIHPKTGYFKQEIVRPLKTLYFTYPPLMIKELISSSNKEIGFFKGLGIPLREENGRLYPAHLNARTFSGTLCTMAEQGGVQFKYGSKVTGLRKNESGNFLVTIDPDNSHECKEESHSVILAAGGPAFPAIGGNDAGNRLLESLDIAVHPGNPAIGPVIVQDYPFESSSGTVISASASLVSSISGNTLAQTESDALLFTHRHLSGPLILDICGAVHECKSENPLLILDMLPEMNREQLLVSLQKNIQEHPSKQAIQILTPFFPKSLARTLLEKAEIDITRLSASVTKTELQKTVALVKGFTLFPQTPTSFTEAISWTGGCKVEELDFSGMEAKKVPNLFVTGDMVAMNRPCGGYSLWFCWASALSACTRIIESKA